ncbi:MAG: ATP-binding protein [bacterium]|nr:ATP-binding protein [bacterium]
MYNTLKQVSLSHKYFISSLVYEAEKSVKNNTMTTEKARNMIIESFDNYNKASGQEDFLNVLDSKGNAILLINPIDIGNNYKKFQHESIRQAYERIFDIVKTKGSGTIEYSYVEPNRNIHVVQRRFSYVQSIPQFDLVVVCTTNTNHILSTVFILSFLLFAIIIFVLALSISFILILRYKSLKHMIESIPYPAWVKNINGKVLIMNSHLKKLCLVDSENIINENTLHNFTLDADTVIEQFYNVVKTGEMGVIDMEINMFGKNAVFQLFNVPIFNAFGSVKYVATLARDITNEKETEKQRLEFISLISHELRTPLTALIGSIKIVNTLFKASVPENVNQMLILQEKNALKLKYLIDNILDTSKLDANKMEFDITENNIVPIVELTAKELETYAITYNVSLKVENTLEEVRVNIDKDRYKMCLSNLISNAIKYSKSDTSVDICITKIEDNKVKIAVKNYDAYIPPEKIGSVFGRYDQVDSKDKRAKAGTGLGMYITKQLVEKMNGKIGVSSDEHVTEFYTIFDISNEI